MNIKRFLSVALCFLLLAGFNLRFFAYAQNDKGGGAHTTHTTQGGTTQGGAQGDGAFVSLGNMIQEEPLLLYQDDESCYT